MRDRGIFTMFSGTWPQLMAALSGTVSAISDGMQYGWSAPFIPRLKAADSPVQITETDVTWLEAIYMLGGLVGLPITIYFVDKVGRQKSLILAALSSLTGWILIAFANRVEYLYVARLLTGIAGDVAFVSAPMYIAEIADQKIRGFLASLIYLMMLIGILVVYSIAPYVPIYISSIVGGAILVLQLSTFPFMPESPYYLLSKGNTEKARKSLRWLRTGGDIEKELQDIKAAVERQKSERGRPQDLILIDSNRKALIIMTVLNASQHFSSISVILMNLHIILQAADSVYVNSEIAAIIFSALMLVAATFASFIIDKYGRKILLVTSSILTGLSLLTLATYFALKENGHDVRAASWIPIVAVMVYAVVFKFGLGMIPIVMTAELFPTKVKAMGMTISDAMYVIFALVSIYLYQYTSEKYGQFVPFYIFGSSCIATAIFAILVIPETKGKSLEEIQFILKGQPYVPPSKLMENGGTPVVSESSVVLKDCSTGSNGILIKEDNVNESVIRHEKGSGENISIHGGEKSQNGLAPKAVIDDDDIQEVTAL